MRKIMRTTPAKPRPTSGTATVLQVRRAWERHYGRRLPDDMTFQTAAAMLCRALGAANSVEFIRSMSNDPSSPD